MQASSRGIKRNEVVRDCDVARCCFAEHDSITTVGDQPVLDLDIVIANQDVLLGSTEVRQPKALPPSDYRVVGDPQAVDGAGVAVGHAEAIDECVSAYFAVFDVSQVSAPAGKAGFFSVLHTNRGARKNLAVGCYVVGW